MHVNVYHQDLADRTVTLVTKNGYIGLRVRFGDSGKEAFTIWSDDQNKLAAILEQFSVMVKTGKVTE